MSDAAEASSLARLGLRLVEIPSPYGAEGPLADWVEAWMRRRMPQWRVVREGHSLLAVPAGRPRVLLAGHLDTVASPCRERPRIEAGRLYGRGAADMKSGLAVMLSLAASARQAVPFALALYEREEGPYADSGLEVLLARHREGLLGGVDFGVCLEPTACEVQFGAVGSLYARVRYRGRAAHAARPWQGDNALHRAGLLLARLHGRPPRAVTEGPWTWREVIAATVIECEGRRNVVPDRCEVVVNVRVAPGHSLEDARAAVREAVEGTGAAEVVFEDPSPPGPVCADHPLARALVEAAGGRQGPKQAWTDVGRLAQYGIAAVNFGPGDPARAHQADESTPIPPMADAYETLRRWLDVSVPAAR